MSSTLERQMQRAQERLASRLERLKERQTGIERLRGMIAAYHGPRNGVSMAESLESIRAYLRLTHGDMANVLGVATSHYSEAMRGKRSWPTELLRRAHAIGVPAETVLAALYWRQQTKPMEGE